VQVRAAPALPDLAEEGGGQPRPDPEQLQQAGVGLSHGSLDARLDGGDPLLQLVDVGDELAGQLPAFGPDPLRAVAGAAGLGGGGVDGVGNAVVLAGLPEDRVGSFWRLSWTATRTPRARAASRQNGTEIIRLG
jgi:hypothetical protein